MICVVERKRKDNVNNISIVIKDMTVLVLTPRSNKVKGINRRSIARKRRTIEGEMATIINGQAEENEQRMQAEMSVAEAKEKAAEIGEGNTLFKNGDFDGAAKVHRCVKGNKTGDWRRRFGTICQSCGYLHGHETMGASVP